MIEVLQEIAKECAISILPLIVTFLLFQIFSLKLRARELIRIFIGVLISFTGLVLFLFGLDYGYVPLAREVGMKIAGLSYSYIILPIGFLLGFVMTKVEPSVKVLVSDIDRETNGAIPKKLMENTLALGVGLSLMIAMLKILCNLSLWYFLIPGYVICLLLAFVSDERFTSIAFDAGGVTTGVMTTTFLLSMALGLADGRSATSSVTDGFGLIALVAMTPIIMVMLLGKIYDRKAKKEEEKYVEK